MRRLESLDLDGKRVFIRADLNVPLEGGKISDATRIEATLPTIRLVLGRGGRAVVASHLGRPKGKPNPEFSLRPVAAFLGDALGQRVDCAPDCVGEPVERIVNALGKGQVVVLENLRFHPEEEKNDPGFAAQLARLGDVYVNDAFGAAHRAHSSTAGVASHLRPAVAGLLMEKELEYLGGALSNPQRPFIAILGGAKISGKIDVIEALLPKVDGLLIGGAMANTFFKAMGLETGKSLVEPDRVELAKSLVDRGAYRLTLPHDAVVAPSLEQPSSAHAVRRDGIPPNEAMYDIGPDTARSYGRAIAAALTILWNGPMGVFETSPFDAGTRAVAQAMADATAKGATTIVGGGDSAAAVVEAGLESRMSHVSTGGGASLEFLEGKPLPGVDALEDRR